MTGRVLTIAALAELATGVTLLVFPSLVVRLLIGGETAGTGLVVGRVAGIALIALGIACLPGGALAGMLTYSALVAIYLGWLGLTGAGAGVLLWPAVVIHVVISVMLIRAFCGPRVQMKGNS